LVDFLLDLINYPHLARAAITAIVIGIASGVVGSIIILRGLSLMGDAISHAVMPGIAMAFLFGSNIFLGALISGLLAAAGIGFVNTNSRLKRDTSIGIVFTAFLACGVLIWARTQSAMTLESVLFGNVLSTSKAQMWQSIAIAVVILVLVVLFYKQLLITTLDAEVAKAFRFPSKCVQYGVLTGLFVVTVSAVRTVCVILVVAMLITPAATAYLLVKKFSTMLWLAAVLGMLSSVAGMYCSYTWELQSGHAIMLVAFTLFLLAFFCGPIPASVSATIVLSFMIHYVARVDCYLAVCCVCHELQLYLGIAIRACHCAGCLRHVLSGFFLWPIPSICLDSITKNS